MEGNVMRPLMRLFLAVALLSLPARSASASITTPVKVESGSISGAAGATPDVIVFKGVPFAAPPLGDLRWREPKPAPKWEGVRAADKYSPICTQNDGGWYPPNNGTRPTREISEDCLYLNIYTSAKSPADKQPVIVFVHG